MTKNKLAKKDDIFDFSEMNGYPSEDAMADIMSGLIEASNHQAQMAIELTKLIVQNNSEANITEERVFSIFKKASHVVGENHSLKIMMEQFGMN